MQGVADNSEEFDISEVQQIACPSTAVDKNVDARIREISPRFCEVYNQCYIAKQNNLSELYGTTQSIRDIGNRLCTYT